MRRLILSASAVLVLVSAVAYASETITYSYDARGRLTKVVRADPATNTVTSSTEYNHDKADNRTRRETQSGQ